MSDKNQKRLLVALAVGLVALWFLSSSEAQAAPVARRPLSETDSSI